jgi:hypothetical protein
MPKEKIHLCQHCKIFEGTSFEVGLHLWENHLCHVQKCPLCKKLEFVRKHLRHHGVCLVCLKRANRIKKPGKKNCRFKCEDEFMATTVDEFIRKNKKDIPN